MPAIADSTVWLVDARGVAGEALLGYLAWLNQDELERYRRFVRPERQRQFVIGRVLLRQALGALFAVSPRKVELAECPGDAPALVWPQCGKAGLSISHSGAWVACAVSATTKLGLDIEVIDPARDVVAMAAHAFGSEQATWLAARPQASVVLDFYELWCRHEARIKLKSEHCLDYVLRHRELAMALCSATRLAEAPMIHTPAMPGGNHG